MKISNTEGNKEIKEKKIMRVPRFHSISPMIIAVIWIQVFLFFLILLSFVFRHSFVYLKGSISILYATLSLYYEYTP